MANLADSIDVRLTSMAYGGEAVGRLTDGRVVFVPYALPGELVRVHLAEGKKNFVRAQLVEVIDPSKYRVKPRCPHFMVCGGCQYQHISYPAQIEIKGKLVSDQLSRIGGLTNPPVRLVVPSPAPWNYRNHLQFHVDLDGKLGFREYRSNRIVPVSECHLPEESINVIWPLIELDPGSGVQRVSLRMGWLRDVVVYMEGVGERIPEVQVDEVPASVIYANGWVNVVIAGSDDLVMGLRGRLFKVSVESFFQVNNAVLELMINYLLEWIGEKRYSTILELYAGVGLLSAFLANVCGRLVCVEISSSACQDFVVNLDQYDFVDLYEMPVEDISKLDIKPDVIVTDPPRTGMGWKVIDRVISLSPARVAYISCDISTLARDAKLLAKGGYHLVDLTPFDMFPQTMHIETVSIWDRG
jgi:23S rRNA (uracil1939-C5)-methyltransferase